MPTAACALIDSHCHPHFPPLGEDIDGVLADMAAHNVVAALLVATTTAETDIVKNLCAKHRGIFYAACGIHPLTDEELDWQTLARICAAEEVLAVGETGLDFYRQGIAVDVQRRRFAEHIQAALSIKKPLVIHTRDSQQETQDMLLAENAAAVGGVMHCWTGDIAAARRALDMNFMVSFSGIVSFKNAADLREVARFVPSTHYLVETDSPYLAPVPHRGKGNTPGYVRYVAQAVARARACEEEQVARETSENFARLFRPNLKIKNLS